MADDSKKPASGSKLSRSEITSVRLDPKLRYLAELGAKKQRRTVSSYIEWAVEKSLEQVVLSVGDRNEPDDTLASEAANLWDIDESERFIKLAIRYPDLLDQAEQERWKLLRDSKVLSPAHSRTTYGSDQWNYAKLDDTIFPAVRQIWGDLVEAHKAGPAAGAAWVRRTREAVDSGLLYPQSNTAKTKARGFDDIDDDIPF